MKYSLTQNKSIRFDDTMIEAVSLLKEKEDSFSSYIKNCLVEKIERDHGIPIDKITDITIVDRVKRGDFPNEALEKIVLILKSTLPENN